VGGRRATVGALQAKPLGLGASNHCSWRRSSRILVAEALDLQPRTCEAASDSIRETRHTAAAFLRGQGSAPGWAVKVDPAGASSPPRDRAAEGPEARTAGPSPLSSSRVHEARVAWRGRGCRENSQKRRAVRGSRRSSPSILSPGGRSRRFLPREGRSRRPHRVRVRSASERRETSGEKKKAGAGHLERDPTRGSSAGNIGRQIRKSPESVKAGPGLTEAR